MFSLFFLIHFKSRKIKNMYFYVCVCICFINLSNRRSIYILCIVVECDLKKAANCAIIHRKYKKKSTITIFTIILAKRR